jgi:hypothetical protein
LSIEIENVRKDIRMRVETDSMMSSAWILVYLIPFFATILWGLSFMFMMFAMTPMFGGPSYSGGPQMFGTQQFMLPFLISVVAAPLLMLFSFIVSIILIYKLVKRRNTHFKRQLFLFEDLIAAVKTIAEKKGVDVEVDLSSCERTVREAKAEETEKGAVLWAILSAVIFLAAWYVYYFLMKDFYKHERREEGFWEDITKTLNKCGVTFSPPRRLQMIPQRSFVLYLILNIITLGLFGIYWIYVLLKDPNQHFKYHIQIEDQLLSTLESVTL